MLRLTREMGEAVIVNPGTGTTIEIRLQQIESAKSCRFTVVIRKGNDESQNTCRMELKEKRALIPQLVTMQLQDIERGQIRLGFDAPRSVKIDREETL